MMPFVPAGLICYTIGELEELFDKSADDVTRRLVHEGKKLGGQIKRQEAQENNG